MEAAVKLARQYFLELSPAQNKRTRFISRRQSYHGITLGALAVGGHEARREKFEPMLMKNVSRVSPCNSFRGKNLGETDDEYVGRLAKELDDEFQAVGPETVCAFVAEPVVGAVGALFEVAVRPVANWNRTGARVCSLGSRVLQGGPGCLPKVRCAPHLGRGHVRHGPVRNAARVGAGRSRARYSDDWQGPRRWLPTGRGSVGQPACDRCARERQLVGALTQLSTWFLFC